MLGGLQDAYYQSCDESSTEARPMNDKLSAFDVLLSCFSISSLGGLAALLRSGKPLHWRTIISALLYSGVVGLVIGLVWYRYFSGQDNIYFLIGVSGLAGLGGTTLLDFVVQAISRGGINIQISPKRDRSDESLPDEEEGQ